MERVHKEFHILADSPFFTGIVPYEEKEYITFCYDDDNLRCHLEIPRTYKRKVKFHSNLNDYNYQYEKIETYPSWFQELYNKAAEIDERIHGMKRLVNKEVNIKSNKKSITDLPLWAIKK